MIAFDTNLLVRIAVNDDKQQAAVALDLLENYQVFISRTVLLETEWVLRSVYKNTPVDIADFFAHVLVTENIIVENSVEVEKTIKWCESGADFADAMHLSVCNGFMMHTFDGDYCKEARRQGITPEFQVL